MLRAHIAWSLSVLLVLGGCSSSGGGGGGAVVRDREPIGLYEPDWAWSSHKRIAVLPAQADDPQALEGAEQLTDWLADMLERSGHFTVVDYSIVKGVIGEDDVARLADADDPQGFPGVTEDVQALVVCKITEFETDTSQEQVRADKYALDKKYRAIRDESGAKRVIGQEEYVLHRHRAAVGGTVRVLAAATGKVLLSHTTPAIPYERTQRDALPRATSEELAIEAARELAADFFKRISPYRLDVRYKGAMLRVAMDYYRGEYEEHKGIPTYAEKVILVVRDLPHQCDRGTFTMTLTTRDGSTTLAKHTFSWSPAVGKRGETVAVPIGELKATGTRKFTAALYAGTDTGAKPVLDHDFKLDKPEGD